MEGVCSDLGDFIRPEEKGMRPGRPRTETRRSYPEAKRAKTSKESVVQEGATFVGVIRYPHGSGLQFLSVVSIFSSPAY